VPRFLFSQSDFAHFHAAVNIVVFLQHAHSPYCEAMPLPKAKYPVQTNWLGIEQGQCQPVFIMEGPP
jgi:hypothetical protein